MEVIISKKGPSWLLLIFFIFPFIETAMENESNERNISFYGFCNLLKELRTVLLQDSVIFKKALFHPRNMATSNISKFRIFGI